MPQLLKKIIVPGLLAAANNLPTEGLLMKTDDDLFYLKINDKFIHELYPFLARYDATISKPDYFDEEKIGAHISVFYPEEDPPEMVGELGRVFSFSLLELFRARFGAKIYYALQISSKELTSVRQKYGYPRQLLFKNKHVPFHITLGTILISI